MVSTNACICLTTFVSCVKTSFLIFDLRFELVSEICAQSLNICKQIKKALKKFSTTIFDVMCLFTL